MVIDLKARSAELTTGEVAAAIGAPRRWVRDASAHLPAVRRRGLTYVRHADLGAYSAAWRAARRQVEYR